MCPEGRLSGVLVPSGLNGIKWTDKGRCWCVYVCVCAVCVHVCLVCVCMCVWCVCVHACVFSVPVCACMCACLALRLPTLGPVSQLHPL